MTVAARRLGRARWSDLRLWLGVGLLLASMLAGAALMSRGDDSVVVLRATRDLSTGASLLDVEPVAVAASVASAGYATPDDAQRGGVVLRWPVPAGQLIARAALVAGSEGDRRLVTVPLEPIRVPIDLAAGDLVDVWATSRSSSDTQAAVPMLVLSSVRVAAVSAEASMMSGDVGVVLDVPTADVAALVTASRSGVVDLAAVPVTAQIAR